MTFDGPTTSPASLSVGSHDTSGSLALSSRDAAQVREFECGWCHLSADLCLALRDQCCADCTHYDEPAADPENDVDDIAVQRACGGDKTVTLNRQEAAEAHRRLLAKGLSQRQIAEVLGTTMRSVDRWSNGHTRPITRREKSVTTTTDELLSTARRHPVKKIQAAAKKVDAALERVRALLDEDAGKAEARARVERLEAELRKAKAELRGQSSAPDRSNRPDSKAVRAWAQEHGVTVNPTGIIPRSVIDAYNEAHEAQKAS